MGFLRRIFGGKKSGSPAGGSDNRSGSDSGPSKNKRRWSLIKQSKGKSQIATANPNDTASFSDSLNANKHAIAVAAATAAVAEAALAAAQAAAEVVRLTSGGGGDGSVPSTSSLPAVAAHGGEWKHRWPEEIAAVKIQSAFRGYLAKRALRALKALVKLQALVRGHIVRKKTADMLRRMQTLVRLQSQARAGRVHLSHTLHSTKSPLSQHPVPEYHEHPLRAYSTKFEGSSVLKRSSSNAYYREIGSERARFGSNWFDRWTEENVWDHPRDEEDEKSNDKILEVDTWKPQLIKSSHNNEKNPIMALAYEYDSPTSKKHSTRAMNQTLFGSVHKFQWAKELQKPSRTAESSPDAFSSSSWRRRGPFTPTRSECGYMGHPNYMANTESSRAKVRSMSVPRQRLWDSCPNSEGHAEFRSQQYFTSSTHLGRIGSSNLR